MAACDLGVVVADARAADSPLLFVNPAFERLTGYPAELALGQNCRFLRGTDSAQPGLTTLREALLLRSSCEVVVRNYRRDGTLFWNRLNVSPMLGPRGEVTYFMATLADATTSVQAGQQLLEKQQRLVRTKRELTALALRDGLTGLFNRRCFDDQLEREWNRARRRQACLWLFMIDIDHFKQFNDTHGHQAGDRCLRAVGRTVQELFARGSDMVARYGGEEFVVLASGLDRRQARARAELLRQAVRNLAAEGLSSAERSVVTVSIGLASVTPDERLRPTDLVDLADSCLYQAKALGRDRSVLAPAQRYRLARAA